MFRFTIRDVLWLTALAAVLVAWWLEHRSMNVAYEKLRTSTEYAERRAEEARALAAQEKRWTEAAREMERETSQQLKYLYEQIQPLTSRIELDESGRPVITFLPNLGQPATPNRP